MSAHSAKRKEGHDGQDQEHRIDRRLDHGARPRRLGNCRRSLWGRQQRLEQPAGLPPQRADETLLTGDTAAQVRKAALAKVSGGTIERVETDADGNAAYEAHMVRSDGTRVTVYVDKSFDVISVKSGP